MIWHSTRLLNDGPTSQREVIIFGIERKGGNYHDKLIFEEIFKGSVEGVDSENEFGPDQQTCGIPCR